jgi:hypothetical protein
MQDNYSEFRDELMSMYEQQSSNFKIITTKCANKKAYIYFSSNGLYFPNTKDAFTKTIIEHDRYEWEKNLVPNVEKHILVRDLFKGWYLKGINQKIGSLEALTSFLSEETEGYEVSMIGSSAGGFAAVFAGIHLQAARIFNFNGQFNLENQFSLSLGYISLVFSDIVNG